jgi:tetratricopeptide (TPR) repeat protein
MNRTDETWHRLLFWTDEQAPSERLAAQVLLDQGFTDLDPIHPRGGPDGRKDARCKKDGQPWIMAVYFPHGQQQFSKIKSKFEGDFAGVAMNGAIGIAFVTNQELTDGEREVLTALCGTTLVILFHVERVATILDQPRMAQVRQQFLQIETTPAELPSGCLLASDWRNIVLGDIKSGELHLNGQRYPLHRQPIVNPSPSITSLLTWSSRIPEKLIGRGVEMADLIAWAERTDDVRLRVMYGGGGVGKTRLAVEFGDALRVHGWESCLISPSGPACAFQPGINGTLLIIDYPEYHPQAVKNLLQLLKSGGLPSGRWRLLLLSRNTGIEQEIDQAIPNLRDASLEITALATPDYAWELFLAGSADMRCIRGQAGTPVLARERFDAWLARDARHADPLIILAFALNLLDDPVAQTLGRAEILQSLVRRECGRIKQSLLSHSDVQYEGALLLKALAALTGGLHSADITALKGQLSDDEIPLPSALALKRTPLWVGDVLPEMQPDILAAQLIHIVMQDYLATSARIGAWIWQGLMLGAPDNGQLRGRFSRLARLSLDWTGQVGGQYCLIDAMVPDQEMAARLEWVFATNQQLEWPLFGLVVAVGKLRLLDWEAKAAEDFAQYGPVLATSLNNLSVDLAALGDQHAALAAIQRAVTIREDLMRQNFAAHGPDLASSLNNLSVDLAAVGDQPAALAAIQRAVTIYEDLARQNFAAYGPDLAMSLNTLSNRLAAVGDQSAALAAIQRAVTIREDLARQNFAAYGPDLAMSLNNLSVRLAYVGDQPAALAAIQRAVTMREDLARQNFAAYGPDLAMSLHNLSLRLADVGEHPAALAAIQRAVTIYEDLARQNFAAYGSVLATSLHNLSLRLAAVGDQPAALAAIQRSVAIREDVARKN